MTEPTAELHEDGTHFWWTHTCRADVGNGPQPYQDVTLMPHGGGTWRVVQSDPLTVEPSINCLGCGTHGWIRDGRWVPA